MTTDELQALSDDALRTLHAQMLAEYSVARASIEGSEYMPWIQSGLAEINRELERRGATGSSHA